MNPFNFRYDINGLRGIAVIAVLIFHYNNSWLNGGFAGVDVFFVISGYLMTSIIIRSLQNNSFSFLKFYKARAKRIVPALLMVCLILICSGCLLFEPMTYQLVGKHVLASLLFISNMTFYNEAGYFDVNSQYKFFLHTWSLSVEWQFYLLYPIVLSILYYLCKINILKKTLIAVTIASFILSLYYTSFNPTFAFYMLPTRMWELLVGGLAFLYPTSLSNRKRTFIEILGLVIILLSFIFITDKAPWSGYFLIFPVFGAYCCILANNQKTLLKNYIIQKIGLISYSLYLIHWPIIVFFKTLGVPLHFYIYFLLTFPLAFCTYFFIERKRSYQYKTICLYLIILACGYYISLDGIGSRVKNPTYRLDYRNFFFQYYGGIGVPTDANITHFNDNGQPASFILTGDSHARQYGRYFIHNHHNFIGLFSDGCIAMPNLYIDAMQAAHDTHICPQTYSKLQKLLQDNPKTNLIMIFRWDIYNNASLSYYDPHYPHQPKTIFEALPQEIEQLIKIGGNQRQYFIVGQPFENYQEENIFQCYAKQQLFFYQKILPLTCGEATPQQRNPASILLNNIAKQHPNIHFIDPTKILCKNNQCPLVDQNHNPILSDVDHLSTYGANIVGPYIMDQMKKNTP